MIVFLTGAAKIAIKRPTLECELPCTDFHTLSSSPPGCVHPSDAEEARSQAMMLSASRFLSYRLWQIAPNPTRSEEHTSELQSLMRISYAVFCLQKQTTHKRHNLPVYH